jgi:hypothetical protein
MKAKFRQNKRFLLVKIHQVQMLLNIHREFIRREGLNIKHIWNLSPEDV